MLNKDLHPWVQLTKLRFVFLICVLYCEWWRKNKYLLTYLPLSFTYLFTTAGRKTSYLCTNGRHYTVVKIIFLQIYVSSLTFYLHTLNIRKSQSFKFREFI